MPLSITTAGRDVAGSMRRRRKEAFVLKNGSATEIQERV